MIVQRFEVPGLAHYSCLLGSNQQAVVIDPERNPESYLQFAEWRNLRITHILETDIHADFSMVMPGSRRRRAQSYG
jgi:hydroxyacylglutathione hydrolase